MRVALNTKKVGDSVLIWWAWERSWDERGHGTKEEAIEHARRVVGWRNRLLKRIVESVISEPLKTEERKKREREKREEKRGEKRREYSREKRVLEKMRRVEDDFWPETELLTFGNSMEWIWCGLRIMSTVLCVRQIMVGIKHFAIGLCMITRTWDTSKAIVIRWRALPWVHSMTHFWVLLLTIPSDYGICVGLASSFNDQWSTPHFYFTSNACQGIIRRQGGRPVVSYGSQVSTRLLQPHSFSLWILVGSCVWINMCE